MKYLFLFISFFVLNHPLFGQFHFDRIDDDPLSDYKTFNFWSSPYYNRVEGLFIHGGCFIKALDAGKTSLDLQTGFSLENQMWHYRVGVEKRFSDADRVFLRAHLFQESSSNEEWVIGNLENSIACLLLREDFRNYYGKRGYRLVLDLKLDALSFMRFKLSRYAYRSMQKRCGFAPTLFSWSKSFRPNPAVVEADESVLEWSVLLDYRNNSYFPSRGWYTKSTLQKSFGELESMGLFFQGGLYIPTLLYQHIATSVYLGFRKNSTAPQHVLSLGGIGSLRAFPEFYRQGQNLIFWRFNYLFGGSIVRAVGLYQAPVLDSMSFGLFFEAGDAWSREEPKQHLLQDITQAHWLADSGLSLLLFDGLLRFDFAWAVLQAPNRRYRLTMRLLNKL